MRKSNFRPSIIVFFEEGTPDSVLKERRDEVMNYLEGPIDAITKRSPYPLTYSDPAEVKRRKYVNWQNWLKKKRAEVRKHKYRGHIPKLVKEALGSLTGDTTLIINKLTNVQAYLNGIDSETIEFKKIYIEPKFAKFLSTSKHVELILRTNFSEEYRFTEDFIKNYKSYFYWQPYNKIRAEMMSKMRKEGRIMPKSEIENRIKYGCLKPAMIKKMEHDENKR